MSDSSSLLLREVEVFDESGASRQLQVPIERPLTIVIDGQELVTLMTIGAKPELLTLGYLRNQRLIDSAAELESIQVDWSQGRARVARRVAHSSTDAPRLRGMACGLGTEFAELMRQLDSLVLPVGRLRISRDELLHILDITRVYDAIHRAAGSVHGCALFRGKELLLSLEDVSRHNGVDTVVGWMMLHGVKGEDKTMFTTGRLTGEMVMKAAHNGISVMVSRNGVTSMGHDLAVKLGMVLFGRAAKGRYLCYCGADRFDSE